MWHGIYRVYNILPLYIVRDWIRSSHAFELRAHRHRRHSYDSVRRSRIVVVPRNWCVVLLSISARAVQSTIVGIYASACIHLSSVCVYSCFVCSGSLNAGIDVTKKHTTNKPAGRQCACVEFESERDISDDRVYLLFEWSMRVRRFHGKRHLWTGVIIVVDEQLVVIFWRQFMLYWSLTRYSYALTNLLAFAPTRRIHWLIAPEHAHWFGVLATRFASLLI